MSRDELIKKAQAMSLDDQAVIAGILWRGIKQAVDAAAVTPDEWRELDRRLALYEANPDDVIPWSEVKAQLAARR